MVGPSKILTVSYGTFSCTLEGFDNPFSTMRGIAEYFRDLAADDRYFGAEPPIPDAEMLHRIAEADADKRVVAQVEDNGVTLRQVDADPVVASGVVADTDVVANDPFVDEPADIVALNEPSLVETESVAAKLARIRAVVSQDNGATDLEDETVDEGFTSSPISSAFEEADDGGFEELDADQDSVDETEAVVEAEVAEAVPEPVVEPEELEDTDKDAAQDTGEDTSESDTENAEPEADADEPAEDEKIAEFMDADSEQEAENISDDVDDAETEDNPDSSAISRIIKMRRSDFVSATEHDAPEETGADEFEPLEAPENDDEVSDDQVSTLSPEDEAELMANLEKVQRKADAEERAEKEGRALLENQDIEASAESVSRILDVTNTELEETEGTRRRSAIAHLKAAVAATRADKFLSRKREKDEAEELSQYRDDLAKVVKPRRPADSGKSARQAPLMLVSEQRVEEPDQEVADGRADIQPRRISADSLALSDDDMVDQDDASGDNMFVEDNGFAEFAQEMGASDLPDLLEAAAAYSAYVEGNAHFSRPQIMQAVASVKEEEFTREEGLRSFGLLLRRGKIKKLKRGQFAVAETTRFNPHARAVGE